MKNYEAHKQAKIRGQNAVNRVTNELVPLLLQAFKPFVGTKIALVTGGFAKKFKEAIPQYDAKGLRLRWNVTQSGFSLWFEADVCEGCGDDCGCHYMKQAHYLGEIDNSGTLVKLCDSPDRLPKFKTDFTLAQIDKAIEEAEKLERKARALRFSVEPFSQGIHGN